MHIRAVTPIHVDPDEVARRQARYDRLSPPGLTVELVDVGPDAPASLDTESEVRASDRVVAAHVRALRRGSCDLVAPDCVLDPGVDGAEEGPLPVIPVVGVLRLAAGHLDALGRPFASVTRNAAIGAELERRLAGYGLTGRYVGNLVMDLDFAAVTDHARWTEAASSALGELGRRGASAVINGCSAVDAAPAGSGPALIDPVALALRLLAAGAAVGADARPREVVA